jgi:hypothetical protein
MTPRLIVRGDGGLDRSDRFFRPILLSRFKIFGPAADSDIVNATEIRPHDIRVSPNDLEALATIWLWERTIKEQLDTVLDGGRILTLVQGYFDLCRGDPLLVAYQALSRFPGAPRIPTGLWFAIAEQIGTSGRLVEATARKAMDLIPRLPLDKSVFVHASAESLPGLLEHPANAGSDRVVFVIPFRSERYPGNEGRALVEERFSARIAVDNVPSLDAWLEGVKALGATPGYVIVDLSAGLEGKADRASYSRLAEWCHHRGVTLIAKRVELVTDLTILRDLGFAWAQGHSLSTPTEI